MSSCDNTVGAGTLPAVFLGAQELKGGCKGGAECLSPGALPSTADLRSAGPQLDACAKRVFTLYVMDEARHTDDSLICALANGGGLLKAFPASESVPRTTIEAPNTPSPALSVTRILAAGFSS